jgi:hypothetical protein
VVAIAIEAELGQQNKRFVASINFIGSWTSQADSAEQKSISLTQKKRERIRFANFSYHHRYPYSPFDHPKLPPLYVLVWCRNLIVNMNNIIPTAEAEITVFFIFFFFVKLIPVKTEICCRWCSEKFPHFQLVSITQAKQYIYIYIYGLCHHGLLVKRLIKVL